MHLLPDEIMTSNGCRRASISIAPKALIELTMLMTPRRGRARVSCLHRIEDPRGRLAMDDVEVRDAGIALQQRLDLGTDIGSPTG